MENDNDLLQSNADSPTLRVFSGTIISYHLETAPQRSFIFIYLQ